MPTPQEKELYLAGRWEIDGRRLRYEAGSDICLAALQILVEFLADTQSPYFACVHPQENIDQVVGLIARAREIIRLESECAEVNDMDLWPVWLKDVADILPRLWD